jgi:hypothetical protein
MTQLPLSNFLTGAGMACISPHRGELEFFWILSMGMCKPFRSFSLCSGTSEVHERVLYMRRSLVYQIDSVEWIISSIISINVHKLNSAVLRTKKWVNIELIQFPVYWLIPHRYPTLSLKQTDPASFPYLHTNLLDLCVVGISPLWPSRYYEGGLEKNGDISAVSWWDPWIKSSN